MTGAGDTGRGMVGIVRWTSTGTGIEREEVVRTAMILGSWISFCWALWEERCDWGGSMCEGPP